MKKRRKAKYDWAAIEADYRAGVLSLRAVAKKHGIDPSQLVREARKRGWERDLAEGVKERVKEQTRALVVHTLNPQERTEDKGRDRLIVDDAARTQIGVILEHRRDIREARELVRDMLRELTGQSLNAEELAELIDRTFDAPGPSDAMVRFTLKKALSLGNRAGTMNSLATAIDRMVRLERQAFGLEDKPTALGNNPVDAEREQEQIEGMTDKERARAILNLVEKVARAKQTENRKSAKAKAETKH